MITTVDEFCDRVADDMDSLVEVLTLETGRGGKEEEKAWRNSFPPLSEALTRARQTNEALGSIHLGLGHLAVEYPLPGVNSWCDAVLLGDSPAGTPHVVIVELKHWDTSNDSPGECEALITRRSEQESHPSDQVKGYSDYCQHFHSAVLESGAGVDGCVYFTRPGSIRAYRQAPNQSLVDQFPVFSLYEEEDHLKFSGYLSSKLSAGNPSFAKNFASGHYIQDRNILRQVSKSLQGSSERPFVLLDEQRRGLALCLRAIDRARQAHAPKQVVIVKGPPGSGKSALAANLWIESADQFADAGNIVFVTTSSCQSTNWQRTFEVNANVGGAAFLIQTSNSFNPGLSGKIVSDLRKQGHPMDYHQWQKCLEAYDAAGYRSRVPDNNHHISIVDEAHALINPETHDIGFASGWCVQVGPQAYHIIRASEITVFLLDGLQSYRDNETTSIDDLQDFAARQGAEVTEISLEGHQFRCGGSVEYLQWWDSVLSGSQPSVSCAKWRKPLGSSSGRFICEIVDTPADLDEVLQGYHQQGELVRLVSSYSVPWISSRDPATKKKWGNPHQYRRFMENIRPEDCDFQIPYMAEDGAEKIWSRPWNFAPK
ncbi:MAG: DUF2075 domain-containing protein [Planctomycetes bacterium]|nr:DUF2075 domain-containing protein [Planctomycetota bacterium]